MKINIALQILFLASAIVSQEVEEQKVKISVYYSPLCSDTVRFFNQQFGPVYDEFKDKMDIELHPYGKASHYWNDLKEDYEFLCQFGRDECFYSKYHACALDVMPFNESLSLIRCLFEQHHERSKIISVCEKTHDIPIRAFKGCFENNSSALMAGHGNSTELIQLTFVPTIVPEGDTCLKRRDNLYKDFRVAFRKEYASKYQKYPDDVELSESEREKLKDLCTPDFPQHLFHSFMWL
ncbi:hypothetical protein DMENIID0001_007920 [Sergentomyia squamirostris]